MESSRVLSLLGEPVQYDRDLVSWLVSSLVHSGVIGLVLFGLMDNPRVLNPSLSPRYSTRLLKLNRSVAQLHSTGTFVDDRIPADAQGASPSGSNEVLTRAVQNQIAQFSQTREMRGETQLALLQPDVNAKVIVSDIPLPSFLLLSAKDSPVKLIVPPAPQLKSTVEARPQPELPNAEALVADINISAIALSKQAQTILPSTTSPVVVHGPGLEHNIPETTANSAAQPSSARVMSSSDIRMTEGTVPVPNAVTAKSAISGDDSVGQTAGASSKVTTESAAAGSISNGVGGEPTTTRVIRPKNGDFGVIVVGASLEEIYPETAEVWNGRLAYTVYLHVGLTRSWILQYSQPRSSDVSAMGVSAHIDAPWPTDMVVPNLVPGSVNADAVLVRGFLNKDGHFEKLAVIFPKQCALAEFILTSLHQWQFRPAIQNGRAAMLEVLLIIPGD